MTTYYLNDPSSSWNVRTNIVQGLYEVPLNLYVNNPSTLTIKNTNIVDSLIYSDAMFSSSLGSLNINSNSLGTSIQCYNDIINIRTTPSANILSISSNAVASFLTNPICSNDPSNNNDIVNKLYVDNPIQQATYVKGGSNSISNVIKYGAYNNVPIMSWTRFFGPIAVAYNNIGFLYPTKDITVTGLATFTLTGTSDGTINEMWLLSFPSLTSNFATVIAKCSNINFWKSTFTTYASSFTESPFSVLLEKGRKYGICCYSNSTVVFDVRGIESNSSAYSFTSTFDLQMGGTYFGNDLLNIGNTFNVNSGFAFETPYVVAYG